jgi:hypothetical protein
MQNETTEQPFLTSKQLSELEFEQRSFMHVDEFRAIIGGKIFSAVFVKKNGEVRRMIARLGVKSHLKGGELTYNPSERNNLIVFDLEKREYRTIKFDNLLEIKYCKKEWSCI